MKKIVNLSKLRWLVPAVLLLTIASCKKYLDNESKTTITPVTQWNSEPSADLFLNDVYSTINNLNDTPDPLDSYTDDNDGGPYWKSWR